MRRRYALDIKQKQKIQKDLSDQIKKNHIGNNVQFQDKKLIIDNKEYSYFLKENNVEREIDKHLTNIFKVLGLGLNQENIQSLNEILQSNKDKILKYIKENFVKEVKVNNKPMYIMEVVK